MQHPSALTSADISNAADPEAVDRARTELLRRLQALDEANRQLHPAPAPAPAEDAATPDAATADAGASNLPEALRPEEQARQYQRAFRLKGC